MRKWPRASIAVAGALCLVGLSVGVSVAAIPDSSGTIHACYKVPVPMHGTPLNIIDSEAGGSCAGGYTAVTWPGAAGVGTTQVSQSSAVASSAGTGYSLTVLATCPSGDVAVGGGFGFSGVLTNWPAEQWSTEFASPEGGSDYGVTEVMTGATTTESGETLTAYADCLPG